MSATLKGTGQILVLGQMRFEKGEKIDDFSSCWGGGLAPFRNLRLLHLDHGRMQVTKHRRDGVQQAEFDTALPHFDTGTLQRAAAEERRIGKQFLEIATDGDRFK